MCRWLERVADTSLSVPSADRNSVPSRVVCVCVVCRVSSVAPFRRFVSCHVVHGYTSRRYIKNFGRRRLSGTSGALGSFAERGARRFKACTPIGRDTPKRSVRRIHLRRANTHKNHLRTSVHWKKCGSRSVARYSRSFFLFLFSSLGFVS